MRGKEWHDSHIEVLREKGWSGRSARNRIRTKNTFFNQDVELLLSPKKAVFKVATMNSKHTLSKSCRDDVIRISLKNDTLDLGVYPIDKDESNEDQIVIYFEDRIEP